MSAIAFESFLSEALRLPVEQRSRLATVLIDSIDQEDEGATMSNAWRGEVKKRARELDDGTVEGLSLEQFRSLVASRVS